MWYVLVTIALGAVLAINNFETTNPQIAREENETNHFPSYNLSLNKIFLVIYVFQNGIENIPAAKVPSLLTFIYTKLSYSFTEQEQGNFKVAAAPEARMPVVPCSEIMSDPQYFQYYKPHEDNAYFKKFAAKLGLCIKVDPSLTAIEGGVGDPKFDFISLRILPCIGVAGLNCEANAEYIKQVTFALALPSFSMNLSNYENPVTPFSTTDMLHYVNENMRMQYTMKLGQIEINDDPGMYYPMRSRINPP